MILYNIFKPLICYMLYVEWIIWNKIHKGIFTLKLNSCGRLGPIWIPLRNHMSNHERSTIYHFLMMHHYVITNATLMLLCKSNGLKLVDIEYKHGKSNIPKEFSWNNVYWIRKWYDHKKYDKGDYLLISNCL